MKAKSLLAHTSKTKTEQNKTKIRKNEKKESSKDNPRDERTLYVGNVPRNVTKTEIKKLFAKYGRIETVRLRGLIPRKPYIPKKLAVAYNRLSDNFKTVIFYVLFRDANDALAATKLNSTLQFGRHIRVSLSTKTKTQTNRSIFVGNLAFDADEEDVRSLFSEYGNVTDVRLVRDALTGIGKGFGYVEFATREEANVALEAKDVVLGDRTIRIQPAVRPEQVKQLNKKQFGCVVQAGRPGAIGGGRPFFKPGRPTRRRKPMKTAMQNKQTIRLK